MRRIAVFCSGAGDSAERLVSLFNEGNRIRVEVVVSCGDDSGLIERLAGCDVETVAIPRGMTAEDRHDMQELLSSKGIELVAFDGLDAHLVSELESSYPGRTISLTNPEDAPREVVAAFSRIDDGCSAEAEPAASEEGRLSSDEPVVKSVDEEWAETLRMNFDESRLASTPPPVPGSSPSPATYAPYSPYVNPVKAPEREPMPSTWLVWAIIVTICCCTIPGIVAIIFSSQVATRYATGDYEGARRASRNAEIWIIVSFVVGLVSASIYLPIMMFT